MRTRKCEDLIPVHPKVTQSLLFVIPDHLHGCNTVMPFSPVSVLFLCVVFCFSCLFFYKSVFSLQRSSVSRRHQKCSLADGGLG